jgi:probable 2-oxoglutarate dehydrogenase E1 component DHKTD1
LDDVITLADAQAVRDAERDRLDTELAQADSYIPSAPMLQGQWKGIVWPADEMAERDPPTGVVRTVLEKIGRASVTVPSGFVRPSFAKRSVPRPTDDVTVNTGYPSQTTTSCKESAPKHREGCRLGLGHSRSELLTLRFTNQPS